MTLNKIKLTYPVNNFFILIHKLNVYLFLFFILFYFFFFIFFIFFFFYNNFLKNNKFYFLKKFIFEFFWILIPFYFILLLFFLSIFLFLKIKKLNNSYLNIKIISYQWKWYFVYLGNSNKNINYFSILSTCIFKIFNLNKNFNIFYLRSVDNNLILPINTLIRLILISNDVIHSLYIPSFSMKQDLIPGFLKNFYIKSNKFGKYYGFCSELCGKNHSYMPFVVNFISNYSYKKWKNSMFLKKFLFLNF
ncbi:hypothetical protein [Candidatus Nasuia deltocephalinicola]|uniref:hypothetical protein n=1 Tax=Candidatus Nasuia deltocephalincola TaxID=1160784 RepID=UPI00216B20B6|nr:hypothetical protein [Candidatus Nasuia deltocephalinicola]